MKTPKSVAIITIYKPSKMSRTGRMQVSQWLRRNADHLLKYGDKYSDTRFTARYMY